MTTITDTAAIATAFADFTPGSDGAYPTCRILPGQWERSHCHEWAERGSINGTPVVVYYIFEDAEVCDDDAGSYPWDADHVVTIVLDVA